MTVVRLRPLAEDDLVERTRYYRLEGGDDLGIRFFDAAIATLASIERMPRAGSPRIGEICEVPGLRLRRITGFPSSWIYFARADGVDVVRLLADRQDLAAILTELDPDE